MTVTKVLLIAGACWIVIVATISVVTWDPAPVIGSILGVLLVTGVVRFLEWKYPFE